MADPEEKTERVQIVAGLSEAVVDGERRAVDVVCIRPGLSKNGNYYAPEVVRAMAPLFEGARAFADHPAPGERPERSIRDIVGYYRAPRVDEDGALRATLKVARHADWLWSLMREAVEDGQPDLIGISIDADARVTPGQMEGRRVRVVEAITRLNSCDVVTRASAGGRIERVLQAEGGDMEDDTLPRRHGGTEEARRDMSMTEMAAQDVAGVTGEVVHVSKAGPTENQELRETSAPAAPPCLRGEETVEESLASLREEIRRERRALACERLLDTALRESALPAPIRERLERRFRSQVFEAGELEEAVADERAVLAALSEAGLVHGMGLEKQSHAAWGPRLGMSEAERLQKAFDQLFDVQEGERVPALSGLREAYVAATGDAGISGISAPERLREADVTTASFSYLLGTSMNKRLLKDYQAWPSTSWRCEMGLVCPCGALEWVQEISRNVTTRRGREGRRVSRSLPC